MYVRSLLMAREDPPRTDDTDLERKALCGAKAETEVMSSNKVDKNFIMVKSMFKE